MNYCYIIRCKDGSFYTGWTNDIAKRFKAHCEGKGAKYTRGRGPLTLVLVEQFDTKEMAMKRECEIKKYTREQKEKLVNEWALNHAGFIDSYLQNKI